MLCALGAARAGHRDDHLTGDPRADLGAIARVAARIATALAARR